MKILIVPAEWDEIGKRMAAMPLALQTEVYGKGFIAAAKQAARKARTLCPPFGKHPPVTNQGKPRRHLRDSIFAVPVSWHWAGRRIRNSAAIVVAEQPHAYLVENSKSGPYLEPALQDGMAINQNFKIGAGRAFNRTIRQLEKGRYTGRLRRIFK